jgi:hypothetical protein
MIGDKDTLDVYDASDPVEARLGVLERVAVELADDFAEYRWIEALRLADALGDERPRIDDKIGRRLGALRRVLLEVG